jgi:hypothetical protein
MKTRTRIEFGDFQTPPALARAVCELLCQQGIAPDAVIEPTCGAGAFLVAAAGAFPNARLLGWDINPDHVQRAKSALAQVHALERASVVPGDFFTHNWEAELSEIAGDVLVLGNLPWVTNAVVSGMNGTNLPAKENFLGLRGMDARTGKSNFDISEWMLICLVKALRRRRATIAMLCKTATARKVLRFAWQNDGRIARACLRRVDAKRHFGASVDACLLLARTGEAGPTEADVFDRWEAPHPSTTLALAGQDLVSDVSTYRRLKHLEGLCPYQWRSGLKHDCASVMELTRESHGGLRNKLGEEVRLEPDYLFPLLKCSDLAHGRLDPKRFVIVPQRRVGEDTAPIRFQAPRTWQYLDAHRRHFEARKSSIYSSRIPFAVFGVGDYSFAPWKVAVSGLHWPPRFALVPPVDGKPVLFDDTCYFIPFDLENEASVVVRILNSPQCLEFLACLTFADAKRPITVELLQRLNLQALAKDAGLADEWEAFQSRPMRCPEQRILTQPELVMEPRGE